jgi:hypothetical protein
VKENDGILGIEGSFREGNGIANIGTFGRPGRSTSIENDGIFGIDGNFSDGNGSAKVGIFGSPGRSRSMLKPGIFGMLGSFSDGIGIAKCGSLQSQRLTGYTPNVTPGTASNGTEAGPPGEPVFGPIMSAIAGFAIMPPK